MPVFENERGTFIFNSKDLCMIEHIPELIKAGVSSFKIEGRVKNELYVATVVKAYREAIDACFACEGEYKVADSIMEELTKVSHREYTNGFYFGKPTEKHQLYTSNTYIQEYTIAAVAQTTKDGVTILEQRNKFEKGDVLEVINPKGENFSFTVGDMYDEWDNLIESAPHAQMMVKIKLPKQAEEFALLRMLNKNYKPEDM